MDDFRAATPGRILSPAAVPATVVLFALLLPLFLLLAGCGTEEPISPEARVRSVIALAKTSAENKDLRAIGEIISEGYVDGRGFNKRAIEALLGHYLQSHASVHLFTRTGAIAFPDPEQAQVELLVAMAGKPITTPEALASMRADLYRFDLSFREEGAHVWRLVRARWRRAQASDFL